MRFPLIALALTLGLIAAAWQMLGRAVPTVRDGAAPRLECVSYAPFRGLQSPLDPNYVVPRAQIDDDLGRLVQITGCIRTYSVANGLDQVPDIARKYGLKVIQGVWLSSDRLFNARQIAAATALIRSHTDVITAVVVGNEVLLRGELSAADLGTAIRAVKTAIGPGIPVTYADVWEFWLRNRELLGAVDFVTIHILPYWEDDPVAASAAAAHVDSIRARVAAQFPGREILIGETGWPSHGRMREAARPSPYNQARVIEDILAAAARGHYRVNVIEAFDQPWKRQLEGTVGGYWGLLDANSRAFKFAWGAPVSDHPAWLWQALGGGLLACVLFAGAAWRRKEPGGALHWAGTVVIAAAAGIGAPWAVENMLVESLGAGGWLRSGLWVLAALAAPLAAVVLRAQDQALPAFSQVIGPQRLPGRRLTFGGAVLILTAGIALEAALGLVFDPRYRDFPFAAFTAAIVPLAVVAATRKGAGGHGLPEMLFAGVLAASAVYIVPNETTANWQALWFSALLLLLGFVLYRVRGGQSPE